MRKFFLNSKSAALAAAFTVMGLASTGASAALAITPITSTAGIASTLESALLAPSSGISVVAGTSTYQGVNTAGVQQSGTYTGFNVTSSGGDPTLSMADGIVLTSGIANIPLTNTAHPFSHTTNSGAYAPLGALSASKGGTSTTFDANVLSFNFNVDSSISSVSAKFLFGTEEFPTQTVTDIFGFFVDGVNFAQFSNGQLISNTPGSPTNFFNNSSGAYGIEFDGLTQVFTVTGLLGAGNADGSHTITIAIADTSDSIYDSAVFINSLTAGTATGGGIGNNTVPEPGSLALIGLALAASVMVKRGKKA